MKARMILLRETLYLLDCTGDVQLLTDSAAQRFLLNFDSPNYYPTNTTNNNKEPIEEMEGETVAYVSDNNILCIENAEIYRSLILNTPQKYTTAPEFAALHGKTETIVRRMCRDGRIEGAVLKGRTWLIPEDTPYPFDNRRRQ